MSTTTTTNGDAGAIVDGVAKPPDGVVLPPKDIRTIIEKTAGYVARSGTVFEQRIRDKEASNPKFSFLTPSDAYNSFYLWRLGEIKEGRGTAVSAGRVGEAQVPAEPEKPKGPAPPPDFHFSARMPNISAQDLEVVRLTALFVAKNGRSFMTTLSQKENRNFQFDFLRPQHSLHQFFSRLVDQYTDLIQAPSVNGGKVQRERLKELEINAQDRFSVLDRARKRAEWVKYKEQQKAKKEEEEQKEQLEYAQIDWHDFVVVQTVTFDEADDQANLPPPASLSDLQSASLEQKGAMSLQPHNMRIEEAMPTADDYSYTEYQQQQQRQQSQPSPAPAYGGPPPPGMSPAPPYGLSPAPPAAGLPPPPGFRPQPSPPAAMPFQGTPDDAQRIAERNAERDRAQQAKAAARAGPGGAPMRIKDDYVPRAQAKRQGVLTAICPNCRQNIPVDEMTEHMRSESTDFVPCHSAVGRRTCSRFCFDVSLHLPVP